MNEKFTTLKGELATKFDRENKESGNYQNTLKWKDNTYVDSVIDKHVDSIFDRMNLQWDEWKQGNKKDSVHEKDPVTGLWKSKAIKRPEFQVSNILALFYGLDFPSFTVHTIAKSEAIATDSGSDIFEDSDDEDNGNERRRRIVYSENSFVKKNVNNFDPNLYGGLHDEIKGVPIKKKFKIGSNSKKKN